MSDRTDPDIELMHAVPTRVADIREFERELMAAAKMAEREGDDAGPAEEGLDPRSPDPAAWLDEDQVPTTFIQLPRHGDYAGDAAPVTAVDEVGVERYGHSGDAAIDEVGLERHGYAATPVTAVDEVDVGGHDDAGDAAHETTDDAVWIGAGAAPVTADHDGEMERTPAVPVGTVLTQAPQPGFRTYLTVFIVVGVVGAINAGFLLGLHMNDEAAPIPPVTAAVAAEPVNEAVRPASEPVAPAAAAPAAAAPAPTESAELPMAAEPAADEAAEAGEAEPQEDPLRVAQRAIEAVDVEAAAVALEQARDAGAEPAARDRLHAQLMVLRGDGAAAVSELRAMTSAYPDDVVIWLALGRALAQAEQDAASERAFERALELDAHSVDAHVGLARLHTRAAHLRTARQRLRSAREAYEQGEPNPVLEARLHVTEGIIGFELGNFAGASSQAERALALDERSAEAHLLLGRIAIEQDRDATEHLRAAIAGRAPPAEALGILVPRAGDGACELADRYLAIAPSGYDARAVRRARSGCR